MRIQSWIVLLMLISAISVSASVPPIINYQGKLMQPSGTAVTDGTYSIQFAIYDVPTGGTALWSEINTNVSVKAGLFSVLVGSVNNLPMNILNGSNRFFGIKVGNDPEMTPRQQIASTAYAFRSAISATVDDGAITASKLAPGVAIPPGGVIMWTGAVNNIPQGWALCDGANGTPNLRDRFVVGAGAEYLVGATGGEKFHQLTIPEMPSHAHDIKVKVNGSVGTDQEPACSAPGGTLNVGAYSTPTGGDQPHENRPPYYALCFIMKLGY